MSISNAKSNNQQSLKVWVKALPTAELTNKTLTLSFDLTVEVIPRAYFYRRACFRVACGGVRTDVTTARIEDNKLILQLADFFSSTDGIVTVSYRKPEHAPLCYLGTYVVPYVPSFENLPVYNNNTEAALLPQKQLGYAIEEIRSMKEAAGAVPTPNYLAAWGGHQSRIVRTKYGVYIATLIAGPPKTRKFGLYRVDGSAPILISEEWITGVAVTLVADRDGNLYVICLDTPRNEDDDPDSIPEYITYGIPTAFKYTGGRGPAMKIHYQGSAFELGMVNYEGAGIDCNGNILFAISHVDNDTPYASKIIWLTLDVKKNAWGEASSAKVKNSELYIFVLPKPDGSASLVTNVCAAFEQLGHNRPPGYTRPHLWFGITLWDIPDTGSNTIKEVWRYQTDPTDEQAVPYVSNNNYYSGDAYIDTKGYAHILLAADSELGLDSYPAQTRYVIFDNNNMKILDRKLFDGICACRFAETPAGSMYIIKMGLGTSKLEVFRVNAEHTDVVSGLPVFAQNITDSGGKPCLAAFSGLCVTTVRGGSCLENFVDIALPRKEEYTEVDTGGTIDWIIFRLILKS